MSEVCLYCTNKYGLDSCNILRILLTTDNHIGYLEKDGIRGNDTFKTLEEILCLAQYHKVDFILQGGDLFHENRPSIRCLNEVLRLFRTYCLNDRPVGFEVLSDPAVNFAATAYPGINYLDANLNVSIPVFAIHGNHDDPSGPGNVCPPDILHTCGFINLFGKSNSVESIEVNPVLIRKGSTNLALYGIGSVREERLHRLFQDNKITFLRPESNVNDWFSLAVVHQNRVRHGPTGYLPEKFLPSFLDLIVWGHEHDCRIVPEWNETKKFYVVQPGSSVATSLSEGEAINKCVGLLEIQGREFKVTAFPLLSSRKFIFEDLVLQDELPNVDSSSPDAAGLVQKLCNDRIQAAIDRSAEEIFAVLRQRRLCKARVGTEGTIPMATHFTPPPEPLVRLRVDTSGGFEKFSALRFGQKFVGRVANPKDLIIFNTKRDIAARRDTSIAITKRYQSNTDSNSCSGGRMDLAMADVESLISAVLSSDPNFRLGILTEAEMASALRQFVGRFDNDAFGSIVDKVVTKTQDYLIQQWCLEDKISIEVVRFAESRKKATVSAEIVDHNVIADPFIDLSPTEVEMPCKRGHLNDEIVLSDGLGEDKDDQMLLESLEVMEKEETDRRLKGGVGDVSRNTRNPLTSSVFFSSENQVSTSNASILAGDAATVTCNLASRRPRRGTRGTTRGRSMAKVNDFELIQIDSEDSSEVGEVQPKCKQKRTCRR